MLKVYCFGNEYVKGDSLAKEIADELKIDGVEFIKCDSVDDLEDNCVILDVANGINKLEILTEVDKLKSINSYTAHDLDLAFFLKLYQGMGKLGKVKIICLPLEIDKESAKKELRKLLPDNI